MAFFVNLSIFQSTHFVESKRDKSVWESTKIKVQKLWPSLKLGMKVGVLGPTVCIITATLMKITLPLFWIALVSIGSFAVLTVITTLIVHKKQVKAQEMEDEERVPIQAQEVGEDEIAPANIYSESVKMVNINSLSQEVNRVFEEDLHKEISFVEFENSEIRYRLFYQENFYKPLVVFLKVAFPELKEEEAKLNCLLANLSLTSFKFIDKWMRLKYQGIEIKRDVESFQSISISRHENGQDFIFIKNVGYHIAHKNGDFIKKRLVLVYSSEANYPQQWNISYLGIAFPMSLLTDKQL